MIRKLAKNMISVLPNSFSTNLYSKIAKAEESWYNSNFLNAIRRNTDPALVRWKCRLGIRGKDSLNLHLGCGNRHFQGYINIDLRKTRATDLVCDIRKLPYRDGSVQLIETYHVIEHLPRHDLPRALKEWHRILMPGGKLIIECPDFDQAVWEYIGGNTKRIDNIFGLQRRHGDTHQFGYNFERLERLVAAASFKDIQHGEPQDYHSKDEPCLRVECIKGTKL